MKVVCDLCRKRFERSYKVRKYRGEVTAKSFCSKRCFGLERRARCYKPKAQRKAEKQAYDAMRREALADQIKAAQREYHLRTYDPEKAREARKATLPRHRKYIAEYNRRPENRKRKHEQDIARAAALYGEYADAWRLYLELKREIIRRVPDRYERLKARGYYDRQGKENQCRRTATRC